MSFWNAVDNALNYPLIRFGSTVVNLYVLFDFIIIIALAFLASYLVRRVLFGRFLRVVRLHEGVQYIISRIAGYVAFILGLFIGLQALGIDLTSFTVLAGAVGLGIGFGLQNIINNFISGIIILSERAIQVGDRIEIGGTLGSIRKIGARSSLLLTADNLLLIVPNAELISQKVISWGRGDNHPLRLKVEIEVDHRSDLLLVKDTLIDVTVKNPHVLKHPLPAVEIENLKEKGVLFTVYFWTEDMSTKTGTLKTEIYMEILREFNARSIALAYPQFEISLVPNETL